MARSVIAGPCVSEFGWELLEWQGHVRALAQGAHTVVICSTEGFLPIYADMSPVWIGHKITGSRDAHMLRPGSLRNPEELTRVTHILAAQEQRLRKLGHKIVRIDDSRKQPKRRSIKDQRFVKYGKRRSADQFELVLHARARHDAGPCGGDNYPPELWEQLLRRLEAGGLFTARDRVVGIGTRSAADLPEGVADRRDSSIRRVIDTLASSPLTIGPSSGPMHLASLCGTPHFVWATDRHQPVIGRGNRERYTDYWNPLNTPVRVELHKKGQPPDPGRLADLILEFAKARVEGAK